MRKLVPLEDRILVERATPPDERKIGSIIVPTEDDPLGEGTILAIGPKVEGLEVGDTVAFGKYAGMTVTLDGVENLMMRPTDLLARITEEE